MYGFDNSRGASFICCVQASNLCRLYFGQHFLHTVLLIEKNAPHLLLTNAICLQKQFMALVGQYDMPLFTSIFSSLYVPVPGLVLPDSPAIVVSLAAIWLASAGCLS